MNRQPYGLTLSLLALAGCNPTAFDDFEQKAPIRVHTLPATARKQTDYGAVVTTLRAKEGGRDVSYVVASAGRGSTIVFNRTWDGSALVDAPEPRCLTDVECRAGSEDIGGVLVPFEVWGEGDPMERRGCVFAPANYIDAKTGTGSPRAWILCASDRTPQELGLGLSELLDVGESLHFSGVGLPPGHPLGVVVFGAHVQVDKGGARKSGGLYRLPDRFHEDVLSARPIKLRDPSVQGDEPHYFSDDPEGNDFGREVAGSTGGELLLAIAQPSKQRVIVASYDDSLPGPVEERFVTRACLATPDQALQGFGERLAFGDITGDGKPELFIGSDPVGGVQTGKQALYMYDGAGLPSAADAESACPEWKSEPKSVTCRDVDGVRCANSGFGTSIAVGDFDGDDRGDLLVGAPLAAVDGVASGAAWIVPGSANGLAFDRAIALRADQANARYGTSVAALATQGGRSEPVIGAPGENALFVAMCTPLEPDFPAGSLCLP